MKDYEKKEDIEKRDKNINNWFEYKQKQIDNNAPVVGMNDWISQREQDAMEDKYNIDWLNYKKRQENSGKQTTSLDKSLKNKWLKDKIEEERENTIEQYINEWLNYKSDQALLGKVPNLNAWLKDTLLKERTSKKNDLSWQYGGINKQKHKKKKNIGLTRIIKKSIKRLKIIKGGRRKKTIRIDASKTHPASII